MDIFIAQLTAFIAQLNGLVHLDLTVLFVLLTYLIYHVNWKKNEWIPQIYIWYIIALKVGFLAQYHSNHKTMDCIAQNTLATAKQRPNNHPCIHKEGKACVFI